MLAQKRMKRFSPWIERAAFSLLPLAVNWVAGYFAQRGNFVWALGMGASIFVIVYLYQWGFSKKQNLGAANHLIEVQKNEIERIQKEDNQKARLVESLNGQVKYLQDRLNEYGSRLVLPSEQEEIGLQYVNMVHCQLGEDSESDIWAVLSLGHRGGNFSEYSSRTSRFALTRRDTGQLCKELAGVLAWTVKNPKVSW